MVASTFDGVATTFHAGATVSPSAERGRSSAKRKLVCAIGDGAIAGKNDCSAPPPLAQ